MNESRLRPASFLLAVVAADPCADIAALGEPDNQVFSDEADAFEEWRERTEPVPVSEHVIGPRKSVPVHILTHDRGWITGKVTRYSIDLTSRVLLEADSPITGGTSGGPVVDDDGRLVGVVSHSCQPPHAITE